MPILNPSGGTAGTPIVRGPYSFAYNLANLNQGVAFYTPTVNDLLLAAWFEIDTAWNGTTPLGDLGTFTGTGGLFINYGSSPIAMDSVDLPGSDNAGLLVGPGSKATELQQNVIVQATLQATASFQRVLPLKFTAATPLKVVVSQDGLAGSPAPGASQGAAKIYVVTATPAAFA